jgi:hypothetical protein
MMGDGARERSLNWSRDRAARCSVPGVGRARLELVLDVPQLQARPPMITTGMHLTGMQIRDSLEKSV